MKRILSSKSSLLVLAMFVSAELYYWSTGLDGIRPLVWIAPIPLLVMSTQVRRRSIVAAAFGAYLLGSLNLVPFMAKIAPASVIAGALIIPALAFALAVVAFRDAILHLDHPLSFAAFPIGWTSYEYLLSIFSPHGTYGSIAYTQSDFLPLIQIASLTGIAGITFILTLIPAAITTAFRYRQRRTHALAALTVALFVGVGSLGFGWIRLAAPPEGQQLRVGLCAIDSTTRYFNTTQRSDALKVVEAYTHAIASLAERGATVIVLPEKLVGVTNEYYGEVLRVFGAEARQARVTVLAGLNRLDTAARRNVAVLISHDGDLLAEYDKVHFIPGLEQNYLRGRSAVQTTIGTTSAGIEICKDMDFPHWSSLYGRTGVGLMLVPAWDFGIDGWLHSRMAMMRGVENGFAVARAANNGLLMVSDACGRIVGEASSSGAGTVLLRADVYAGTGKTFYSLTGDWFPQVNILIILILLVIVLRRIAQVLLVRRTRTDRSTQRE